MRSGRRRSSSCRQRDATAIMQFIDGRRMRILVVVDDCTRECLALIADTSISGIRVARELDRLLGERGKPKTIVSDNGCQCRFNFPHLCRSKIPQGAGYGDQPAV